MLAVLCALLLFGQVVLNYEDWNTASAPGSDPASGFVRVWADTSSGLFKCITSSGAACYFASSPSAGSQHALAFPIGSPGSGTALTTSSVSGALVVPFGCTIGSYGSWSLALGTGDSGTLTVKYWKIATGTAIPTSANSISTSGLSLSTGTLVESSTFTDFTTTTVTAGDAIIMAVTAISGTIDSVTGILPCQ
jgi:hypothetical protein